MISQFLNTQKRYLFICSYYIVATLYNIFSFSWVGKIYNQLCYVIMVTLLGSVEVNIKPGIMGIPCPCAFAGAVQLLGFFRFFLRGSI